MTRSRSRDSQGISPRTQLHATHSSLSAPHRAAFLAITVWGGARERRPLWLHTVINTGPRPPCEGAACGAGRRDLLGEGRTAPSSRSIGRSEAIAATPSTCSWPRAGLKAPGRPPGSVLGLPSRGPSCHCPRASCRGHPRARRCCAVLAPPPPSQDSELPSQLRARLSRHLRLYNLSGRPPSMRFAPPMAEASDTTAPTLPRVPREVAFPGCRLLLLVPPKHGAPGSSGRSGCGRFETTGRLGCPRVR